MFHINEKKLKLEQKEKGSASVQYYEGTCLTCQNSPERDIRAACPQADFFEITIKMMNGVKIGKHICKNWVLCSEITSCFKRNQALETINPTQNNTKTTKYHK